MLDSLFSIGGAAATMGSVLALVLVRGVYKFVTGEATIVITQTCDSSRIVRVRVGFSIPRYVTSTTGGTTLWIKEARNIGEYELARKAGFAALAQLGCPLSKQITVRNRN